MCALGCSGDTRFLGRWRGRSSRLVVAANSDLGDDEMRSLYEQHAAAFDRIAASGKPSIREMARLFDDVHEFNRALGAVKAAEHWIKGRNNASMSSERRAKEWLAAQLNDSCGALRSDDPVAVFFIACPASKARQVERIAAVMGWECEQT